MLYGAGWAAGWVLEGLQADAGGWLVAVFNLCEGIDVEATEAKVKAYESANAASIAANIAKKVSASVQAWRRLRLICLQHILHCTLNSVVAWGGMTSRLHCAGHGVPSDIAAGGCRGTCLP